jgi:hypothetical protein
VPAAAQPTPLPDRVRSHCLQIDLIGQLLGYREDRTFVDAFMIKGNLNQRVAQRCQAVMALLFLEGACGLDCEL